MISKKIRMLFIYLLKLGSFISPCDCNIEHLTANFVIVTKYHITEISYYYKYLFSQTI